MPTCPKCLQAFHRGAESSCPHCGFSLSVVSQHYGKVKAPFRRICDNAGALRHQDRIKLAEFLEKLEQRIRPVALAVYFPNITEPFSLMRHTFWMFNYMDIQPAGFGERRKDGVDPQWLLVLVIDVRTATACFVWGYQLDPYVHIDRINSSIVKARLFLRDGQLMAGIRQVMKGAVRHVVSQAGPVMRHPEKHGAIFKKEEPDEQEPLKKEEKRTWKS